MTRLTLVCLLLFVTQPRFQEVELEPLPDYYATLNISPKATLREIKKSFRKLAQFYHPDKNKDETAQDIFKDLSEAYSVLSDNEKREEYDELYFFFEQQYREENTEDEFVKQFTPEPEEPEETVEPEQEPPLQEKVEDIPPAAEQHTREAKAKESDVWDDLDDEALFKVLKFLADHDYEITKRKVYKETNDQKPGEHSRTRRSAETNSYSSGSRSGHTYRSQTPTGHDQQRTYTPSTHTFRHDQKPQYKRFDDRGPSHYNGHAYNGHHASRDFDRFRSPSGHQYCRTYVSYEGNVKITQKTCY